MRYFLIKYSRTKVIAFDIDEALSFEGESGPYLQYAVVRANEHLPEAAGAPRPRAKRRCWRALTQDQPDAINGRTTIELWALVLEASRLDDVVEQVVRSLEFAVLAKYGFGLAQLFNAFYHRVADSQRGTGRRAAVARGGGGLLPPAIDARARSDGRCRSASNVGR